MTLDDRARDAAGALHDDVAASVDSAAALTQVLAARSDRRRRMLPTIAAGIAVLALVGGVLAATGDGDGGDDTVAVDMDPDTLEGTPLQLLGPTDGRDSIRLPVTIEPAGPLVAGDTVHVTASGFVPGESVGIVQCTNDAGEPNFAGVDACMISPYTSATADADGNIAGDYEVRRFLTVTYSGTVDCASAPGRCMIAVGAISNYDRSGATPIDFEPAADALVLPVVTVTPTDGLTDGQTVHVSGTGFEGDVVGLSVCSGSPAVCWTTGDGAAAQGAYSSQGPNGDGFSYSPSLLVGSDGTVEGDVPVWRFLPGTEPGTYVDCAVSSCSLRFAGELAPAPVPLGFAGIEDAPRAPLVEVTPTSDLGPGSPVLVRGGGFDGGYVSVSLCAYQPADEASPAAGAGTRAAQYCTGVGDGTGAEVRDGAFSLEGDLGDFSEYANCNECTPVEIGADWTFAIEVYVSSSGEFDLSDYFPAPIYQAPPVVIGYQR